MVKFIYKEIICKFNIFKILQSDKEMHFINEIIQKLINKFRI